MSWSCVTSDAGDWLRSLPDRSAALVLTSPPYTDRRAYAVGCNLRGQSWVDWLRPVILEAARVSAGLVVVNAAGPVEDRRYQPVVEWLVADLTRLDGLVCGPAPWAWDKGTGLPGSGKGYQRRDWEPLYSFCLPDRLPLAWTDPLAFGRPTDSRAGRRRVKRRSRLGPDRLEEQEYEPPTIAGPGNVIKAGVGGRRDGVRWGRYSAAPMSLAVAERVVCWYAPPDSLVLDCFAGSGTTMEAAVRHGRRFAGADIDPAMVAVHRRRVRNITPNLVPA